MSGDSLTLIINLNLRCLGDKLPIIGLDQPVIFELWSGDHLTYIFIIKKLKNISGSEDPVNILKIFQFYIISASNLNNNYIAE